MLYMSLGVSVVMLVVVNLIVRRAKYPVPPAMLVCLVSPFVPFCGMVFFPAAALSAVCAGVLLLIVFIPRYGKRLYLPLSLVATLVAYVIVGWPAAEQYQETAKLQQQYPFESMEKRLPVRARAGEPSRPTNGAKLDQFEQAVEDFEEKDVRERGERNSDNWQNVVPRSDQLRALHEHAVDRFVDSPGFGQGRMTRRRTDTKVLEDGGHGSPPVPQPDYASPFVHPPLELSAELPDTHTRTLRELHDTGVLDFVNPTGFGYVKDRGRVAGFQAHGMSKVPAAGWRWSVARLDLVGVVVHDKPVVYLSPNLPRMDELRDAPTRPLDAFETAGLDALRKGEDLYARGTDTAARMLGAVRAAKQCTTCHACERGELLGAFAYGLRR